MLPKALSNWVGMAGVPPHDAPAAYVWEKRLHGIMLSFALVAVAAFYLVEVETQSQLRALGRILEWAVLLAFAAELLWMLVITRQKLRYLLGNWLDVLIVTAAALTVAGYDANWVAAARLLRVAMIAMMLARAVTEMRTLFSPGGLPYILGFAVIAMLAAGAGFYWLDPSVHTYSEGLWLAFVTAATVGYGDVVPTTPASRILAVIIVVIGLALLSTVTATVAALFIGEDEKIMRKEMHQDIRRLREEVAHMIGEEERELRREVREDVRLLRQELQELRRELERERRVREHVRDSREPQAR